MVLNRFGTAKEDCKIAILFFILLKKFFLLEIKEFDQRDQHCHSDHDQISVSPGEFRHIGKVHAIPTGEQRERQEKGRHYRKDSHDLILPCVLYGLTQLAQLQDALAKETDMIL